MSKIYVHTADNVSYFMLNYVSAPVDTVIGRQYARAMVAKLKADIPEVEHTVLIGHLQAWNRRGGSPFTDAEIIALARVAPEQKKKRDKRPHPAPGVALFAE